MLLDPSKRRNVYNKIDSHSGKYVGNLLLV